MTSRKVSKLGNTWLDETLSRECATYKHIHDHTPLCKAETYSFLPTCSYLYMLPSRSHMNSTTIGGSKSVHKKGKKLEKDQI